MRRAAVKNLMANFDDKPNLAQEVFGIESVREMILDLAIRDDDGEVCRSYVRSVRLVQKSWLDSVTKVLQKSKEPLFHLELDKDNSLIENVGEDGKLLDRVLNAMAAKPSVPTFSVKILEDVFVQETHSSLSKMLVRFGTGLVELELHIPSGSLKFIFPNFTLPRLQKLRVELIDLHLPLWKCSMNVSNFINSLLNAAPALTHFVIPPDSHHDVNDNPLEFQLFTLPPSITTLELSCEMTSEHLEFLVNSDLPKLTSLTLRIPGNYAYPDGMLFKILDKCRTTLRELVLRGDTDHWKVPRVVTNFRFPLMEKLEQFSSHSMHCELEPGLSSLETLLPKLTRLALLNQTPDMFRKWTQNSNFKSRPRLLILQLANENVRQDHPDYLVGVNLEMMKSLHLAFPNIRALEVTVSGTQVCGLKYLFTEMKKLVFLRIVVVGSTVGLDRDFWDALLIGVPIHYVKMFRKSLHYWQVAQLMCPNAPTIRNLKDLMCLTLETDGCCDHHDLSATESLISDLTFLLALLKMPELDHLTLKGRFQASVEMAEKWAIRGRTLIQSSGQ